MYDKDGNMVDRREMLKVKLKSLAAEAKIIRFEELKTHGFIRTQLHRHRIDTVRFEARHTHLAYGFIRGKTIEQMEPANSKPYAADKVKRMIEAYGPFKKEVKEELLKLAA